MYLVVSRWEIMPGMEMEFERRGRAVREVMRAVPGVKLLESFLTGDGGGIAIVGYETREAYDSIVNDENGPFAKAMAQHKFEECGHWVWSERGEAVA